MNLGYYVTLKLDNVLLFRRLGGNRIQPWTQDPTQAALYKSREIADQRADKIKEYLGEEQGRAICIMEVHGNFLKER